MNGVRPGGGENSNALENSPPDYDAIVWLADRLEQLLHQLADEADRMAADGKEPAYLAGWLRSGVNAALAYIAAARKEEP